MKKEITKELKKYANHRRTLKGLAMSLNCSKVIKDNIIYLSESNLLEYLKGHKGFEEVDGCKGRMWTLK